MRVVRTRHWGLALVVALLPVCGCNDEEPVVYAWGSNDFGALGDGTFDDHRTPTRIGGLGRVAAVAGGRYCALALTSEGEVWEWGMGHGGNRPRRVRQLSNVVAISAGDNHFLALRRDGIVWAWGTNEFGQCGSGGRSSYDEPASVKTLDHVIAVAAGEDHSVALKADGTVWAWGKNEYADVGDGTTTTRPAPVQVNNLQSITAIASGGHSLALAADGRVWEWGASWRRMETGEVDVLEPFEVEGLPRIKAIADGGCRYALAFDGTLWAWGKNLYGVIGDGTEEPYSTPVRVENLDGVVKIASNLTHALASRPDGGVWTWGNNSAGQLGDGTGAAERHTPLLLRRFKSVVDVAAGKYSSYAVVRE